MPWKNPGMPPKISRGSPEMMSSPTAPNTSPMKMENRVFGMSSPPSPTKVANAISINAKISGAPKVSAISASGGANSVNKTTPTLPPMNDAVAAATSALSALP